MSSTLPDSKSVRAYLSGLRLTGRRVVVVGGGAVVQRRLVRLLESGADVTVIAPEVTRSIEGSAGRGDLTWIPRRYRTGDLHGAWYVLVATDDEAANRAVSSEAEQQQTFCVRADNAGEATAWTPATADVEGVTIGVVAGGHPRRAMEVRDSLVASLRPVERPVPEWDGHAG